MKIEVRDSGLYVEHTHGEVVSILAAAPNFVGQITDAVEQGYEDTESSAAWATVVVAAIKWIFEFQTARILAADRGNGITMLMPWGWLILGWFWFFQINTRVAAPATGTSSGALVSEVPPGTIIEQDDWRHCNNCKGLFYAGMQETAGVCPAGAGGHTKAVSGNYTLTHNVPTHTGQHDWRFCSKCSGLFFAGGQDTAGACPAGGLHGNRSASGDYSLPYDATAAEGQDGWRWCGKCQGSFYAGGGETAGACPAPGGGPHEKSFSSNYTLRHTAA